MFLRVRRILQIVRISVRHGLPDLLDNLTLSWFSRGLVTTLSWFCRDRRKMAVRFRCALEDLGPIFVKFGQSLSTRPDLIPADMAEELRKLQENVPPFPWEQARIILQQSLDKPLDALFKSIDPKPMASASIAQVHSAKLSDGRSVVVKIVRPNIQESIENDLELMRFLARWITKLWSESRRLRLPELVDEYAKVLHWELDLMREAGNASQLRSNFSGPQNILYIPEVHWEYCHKNVMVMEKIYGIRVNDISALKSHKVNFKKLAYLGVEIFFTQVFRDNLFHADMHPGNIFVDVSDPENPRYLGVDFGIVGSLSFLDQRYLAENFMAFFNKDYRKVAQLHVDSGWVKKDIRVDEFEAAIRTVCEPIFQKKLHEISFGRLLVSLFQTLREFDMEIQPQLILLQKTLLNIEGLGRQLYPQLDLWETAKPLLEAWIKKVRGPIAQLRQTQKNLFEVTRMLPQVGTALIDLANDRNQKDRVGKDRLRSSKKNRTLAILLTLSILLHALIWFLYLR